MSRTELPIGALAVLVCRNGCLPAGADEAVAEAGGDAVVVGTGASDAAAGLASATRVWWTERAPAPGSLAVALATALAATRCVIMPASPDGRDLAPRLSVAMGRPLLAGAVRVCPDPDGVTRAELLRVDGQVVVPVESAVPVVTTLLPGARSAAPGPSDRPALCEELVLPPGVSVPKPELRDAELVALIEPDPATMDLADATRVLGGGAGLVPRGATDVQARLLFGLLGEVAASLGASAGATRVVTDAGWTGHERQIGTTGVAVQPALYVAFGVSGATQHTGGLGAPRHTVSVNTDPSCPMTAMANLGLVADACSLLLELADRVGVAVPTELEVMRG